MLVFMQSFANTSAKAPPPFAQTSVTAGVSFVLWPAPQYPFAHQATLPWVLLGSLYSIQAHHVSNQVSHLLLGEHLAVAEGRHHDHGARSVGH
jgi:hypothetical protein